MKGLLTLIGATVGGWAGWSLGAGVGFGTAFGLSSLGTLAGVVGGWWIWQRYLR